MTAAPSHATQAPRDGLVIAPELLQRLQARDRATWTAVLSEHGPHLVGFAARMLGERGRAEDVVQGALLAVMEGIDRYEGRTSIKSWLYRAVHFRALDDLRSRRHLVDLPDEHPDGGRFGPDGAWAAPVDAWRAEEELDAHRMLVLVRSAMDTLPHAYREILLLRETHGMNHAELAETLELSPGNTRIRLHRARQALRVAVAQRME